MADLRNRFRDLDRLEAPDLLGRASQRPPRAEPEIPGPSRGRRVGTVAVAFAVAIAATVFAVRGFRTASPPPPIGDVVEIGPRTNGSMVFLAREGDPSLLLSEIFVAGAAGEDPRRIASVEGTIEQVSWTPEGSRIAYLRSFGLGGGGEIVSILPDGQDPRTLVSTDAEVLQGFAFSPDGAWIAYSRGSEDPAGEIARSLYARPVAGGEEVRLTEGSADDVDPAWSPDGTRIAFSRDVEQGGSDIWVMNADGSNAQRITEHGGAEAEPSWSPDGTRIAFSTGQSIESIRPDGTGQQVLYTCGPGQGVGGPSWSPDGRQIAVDQTEGRGSTVLLLELAHLDAGVVVPFGGPSARFASSCCASWQPVPGGGGPLPARVEARITHTIDVGPSPNAVAVGEGGVWVSSPSGDDGGGDVVRIDPETADIVARIPVDALPGWEVGGGGIAVGERSVWVSGTRFGPDGPDADTFGDGTSQLTRIDPTTNEVADVIELVPGSAADVWVDGSGIWVLAFRPNGRELEVLRLDPITYDVTATISVPGIWSQQLFGAGGSIWVHSHHEELQAVGPSAFYRIDPATNGVVDEVRFDEYLWYTAPVVNGIWARTSEGVVRVDAADGSIVQGPFRARPPSADPFAVDGTGGVWLYGPDPAGGGWYLSRLDLVTGEVTRALRLDEGDGASPVAFALDPTTDSIWVVHYRRSVSRVQLSFA